MTTKVTWTRLCLTHILPVLFGCYWAHQTILMASKDATMSIHTYGKRKHMALTSPQRLQSIKWFESGRSWNVVMASHNSGSSTIYIMNKLKGQLQSFTSSSESAKGLFKERTMNRLNEHKWTLCSISGLQQCVLQDSPKLAPWQLVTLSLFVMTWKYDMPVRTQVSICTVW